jgi:hypothetical protein
MFASDSPAKFGPSVCEGSLCVSAIPTQATFAAPQHLPFVSVDSVQAPVLDCVHEYRSALAGLLLFSLVPATLAPRETDGVVQQL